MKLFREFPGSITWQKFNIITLWWYCTDSTSRPLTSKKCGLGEFPSDSPSAKTKVFCLLQKDPKGMWAVDAGRYSICFRQELGEALCSGIYS